MKTASEVEATLSPIERAAYLHHMIGGPCDGEVLGSDHCYETLTWQAADSFKLADYVRYGDIEPCDPGGVERISCTDDYVEPVYFRVNMRYKETKNAASPGTSPR